MFRNMNTLRFTEPQDVRELRHEIAVWQRAAASLSSYSQDEDTVRSSLLKKVRRLVQELKRKLVTGRCKQFFWLLMSEGLHRPEYDQNYVLNSFRLNETIPSPV